MTIENGTAGQKRNDLICAKFKRTIDTDEISLVVVNGTNHPTTPVDPTIVQQNLLTGGTERLFPLWRVSLDGINIATLTKLFTVQKNLNAFKDSLEPSSAPNGFLQDVNNVRTVTVAFDTTLSFSTFSNGVYKSIGSGAILPPGFVSDEVFQISVISPLIISAQVASYNRLTGYFAIEIYSHTNLGATSLRINAVVTGRI